MVLDRDPLADVANLSSVALTVKRGIRYPHRDYRPVTEAEVKSGT